MAGICAIVAMSDVVAGKAGKKEGGCRRSLGSGRRPPAETGEPWDQARQFRLPLKGQCADAGATANE